MSFDLEISPRAKTQKDAARAEWAADAALREAREVLARLKRDFEQQQADGETDFSAPAPAPAPVPVHHAATPGDPSHGGTLHQKAIQVGGAHPHTRHAWVADTPPEAEHNHEGFDVSHLLAPQRAQHAALLASAREGEVGIQDTDGMDKVARYAASHAKRLAAAELRGDRGWAKHHQRRLDYHNGYMESVRRREAEEAETPSIAEAQESPRSQGHYKSQVKHTEAAAAAKRDGLWDLAAAHNNAAQAHYRARNEDTDEHSAAAQAATRAVRAHKPKPKPAQAAPPPPPPPPAQPTSTKPKDDDDDWGSEDIAAEHQETADYMREFDLPFPEHSPATRREIAAAIKAHEIAAHAHRTGHADRDALSAAAKAAKEAIGSADKTARVAHLHSLPDGSKIQAEAGGGGARPIFTKKGGQWTTTVVREHRWSTAKNVLEEVTVPVERVAITGHFDVPTVK